MTSSSTSPIPSASGLGEKHPQPRIILRTSVSASSSIPSLRPSPSPTPKLSRSGSFGEPIESLEEENELQDDDQSPLPYSSAEKNKYSQQPREKEKIEPSANASTSSLTTSAIKSLPFPVLASSSRSLNSPSPRGSGGTSISGGKSRKSSCEMCHQRKIKCDQQRPACSSCVRKGQSCKYAEEADHFRRSSFSASIQSNTQSQRPKSVTIVNAKDPSIKYTMSIPSSNTSTPLKNGNGQAGQNGHSNHPEWKVAETTNTTNESGSGVVQKGRSSVRRERIVAGFDSDSEDDQDREGSQGSGKGNGHEHSLDGELAALVEGEGDSKAEEIDELEDDDEDQEGSLDSEDKDKKRGVIVDDDLSGELLDLATTPPKKKQKPVTSASASAFSTASQQAPPRTASKGVHNHFVYGRASLPAGEIPPTPATSRLPFVAINRPDTSRFDPYSTPLQNLANSLPSPEMQQILFNTFFNDPFLTEGISLLHPQYMDDFKGLMDRRTTRFQIGDATTLANAFIFLATALRILPDETSKLLLASQVYATPTGHSGACKTTQFPRSLSRLISCQSASSSDPSPLDQRYLDLALLAAQIAEQADPPSIMLVMLKLVLYRFSMLGHRRDKIVLAGTWLAQAVKIAQALGMGKEWEGLTQGERELRRRVMWSLYVTDRHHSFETSFPYTIMDAHQGIHLPSPMAESDLYKIRPDLRELPAHATEIAPTACTALFIHTHLARRITPILDSFATISAANTPHDLVLRFDASLDAFQEALPPYFRLFPLTETRFDSSHSYLAAHRIKLHSTLLSYRIGVHRSHLLSYLVPHSNSGNGNIRNVLAQVCLSSLRIQRTSKMLDSKLSFRLFNPMIIFENATTLALIMHVEKHIKNQQDGNSYLSSNEWISMRNGLSEANELLENVIPGEGLTYSRKAVSIIRELINKLEKPLNLLSNVLIEEEGLSPLKTTIPLDSSNKYHSSNNYKSSNHSRTQSYDNLQNKSPYNNNNNNDEFKLNSISPKSNEKHSLIQNNSISPQKSISTNQTLLIQQNQFNSNILIWLDEIKNIGINLDVLIREPEWIGGWERIIIAM
ncbi:uncharacterized protein I206_102751 [Kwoniella pini CBS 10737]|uniref:Zn(2)-C6 fungal-type domain-containing protein n=1 Tax=Kwoniella pini CBS 10737 TaxID=1296096 RepID=A0A1B9I6D3_9TREE|nr:uncharacterized protein I206_03106 [Kwoniella pini CBS 10737]OCF51041.1 hypothetical protein I206_03106 [Kwoniella pini CBS 10737]